MQNNTKKSLIEFKNVWKIYKMGSVEVPAVCCVNFAIKKGELVGIIGPSGSGKSTLMHLIGLLDIPTKGQIFYKGKDITKFSEDELAVLRGTEIGFVFQTFNLIPTLSAIENVELAMIFRGTEKEKRIKKAKELLTIVGLEKRMEHIPGELSGGERQRVAIARALANDPSIILADEPTGNLDSKTGKEIMSLLFSLKEKHGKTVIIVTHDLDIAKELNKKVNMKDGKITGG